MPSWFRISPSAAVLFAALVVGACALLNLRQPLVRNGFVYARAAEHVIEHGYDPRPVVADSRLSYDKPVGFAWLAAPFVAAFGNHVGLRIVSLLGTLAYLLAVWRLLAAFDPFAFTANERAAALLVATLSPIVVYQGWSAHPDSLFAAVFVLAVALAIETVREPRTLRIAGVGALLLFGLWLKNYAMVLLPCTGLYWALHARTLWRAGSRRTVVTNAVALAVVAAVIASAWSGSNPLLRVHGEGGGADQYGRGDLGLSAFGTCVQIALLLLVNVHAALCGCVRRAALRTAGREWRVLLCFPVPYVVLLLPFPTTFYNMRYFVPVLPFVAVFAIGGLRAFAPRARRAVLAAFTAVALLLIALFDVAPLYRACRPALPTLEVAWIGVPLSLLDNLRMPLHLDEQLWLDHTNATLPQGAVLYFPDASYYGDARHGVYERAGLLRADLATRYVASRDWQPAEPHFWVQGLRRDPAFLQRFGDVTDHGLGLLEVRARR